MYKFSIAAIASPLEANYIQEWVDVPPGSPEIYRKDNEFDEHDLNDVEDTSLIDKFGGKDSD